MTGEDYWTFSLLIFWEKIPCPLVICGLAQKSHRWMNNFPGLLIVSNKVKLDTLRSQITFYPWVKILDITIWLIRFIASWNAEPSVKFWNKIHVNSEKFNTVYSINDILMSVLGLKNYFYNHSRLSMGQGAAHFLPLIFKKDKVTLCDSGKKKEQCATFCHASFCLLVHFNP